MRRKKKIIRFKNMGSNFKAISYRFVQKLTLIQRGYAVLELKNNSTNRPRFSVGENLER